MTKKAAVPFFIGAACFLAAACYVSQNGRGQGGAVETEEAQYNTKDPELLSQVNMPAYVSLPASFESIVITEEPGEEVAITEANVEEVMYSQLLATADRLDAVSDDNKLLFADFTVSQDGEFKVREKDYWLAYSSQSDFYDSSFYQGIKGLEAGGTVRVECGLFDGYEDAAVDITVNEIIDMPYPVTDRYVNTHTEYPSVHDMKQALLNGASGIVKESTREQTISGLIGQVMAKTTFVKIPESLVSKELEALQKDDPDASRGDAESSLYRIFFIAAVMDRYGLAEPEDIQKRYEAIPEYQRAGLTQYEEERMKYLLFEDDVANCIYKKVQIN